MALFRQDTRSWPNRRKIRDRDTTSQEGNAHSATGRRRERGRSRRGRSPSLSACAQQQKRARVLFSWERERERKRLLSLSLSLETLNALASSDGERRGGATPWLLVLDFSRSRSLEISLSRKEREREGQYKTPLCAVQSWARAGRGWSRGRSAGRTGSPSRGACPTRGAMCVSRKNSSLCSVPSPQSGRRRVAPRSLQSVRRLSSTHSRPSPSAREDPFSHPLCTQRAFGRCAAPHSAAQALERVAVLEDPIERARDLKKRVRREGTL